ncbi:MAG: nucleotidyltransferase family protein, partial [Oscillospiraceae bacterium]
GMSFISARTAACEETFSSDNIITTPNDTLGVEYIAAASRLYANMNFLSIARLHSTHDCKEISGRFASACGIRSLIHDKSNFENFVPSPAMDIFKTALVEGRYTNIENLETAILFKLRSMSRDDFSNLPDLSEGLENRIYMVSRTAKSLKELYDTIKTKRYSHARIRRIILSAFLDIKSSYKDAVPSYIRVLACNSTGLEHINFARLRSEIPIAMRATEIRNDPTFLFECKATDLYNLGCFNIQDCGEEYKRGLIKIKH